MIATQPLAHHPALRGLLTALERENPAVALGPLPAVEVGRIAAAALGAPAARAGAGPGHRDGRAAVPGAGRPGRGRRRRAGDAPGGPVRAGRTAAQRLDERLLDTLLISSLGADLGPDDVAAGLRCPRRRRWPLVDRARASGLIEPAHRPEFLRSVHDGIAQIVGAARHHDIEVSVLHSQLELSTLTAGSGAADG